MAYFREIPRDLFNEANLLKCLGKVYINLETAQLPNVELRNDGEAFDIVQDKFSGDLSVGNVKLMVGEKEIPLYRSNNSRMDWPLYFMGNDQEEVLVFSDNGDFSPEFNDFVGELSNKNKNKMRP